MAIQITDKCARDVLDSGYDTIFDGGALEIRTGAPPGPGQAPSGTLLWAEDPLPANLFAAASGRSKGLSAVLSDPGDAAGVAGHYRLKAVGDTGAVTQNEARQEGTVTITGGGGDMTIDNPNIAVGQIVTVTAFSVAL
jgi:hypothetical protein